MSMTPKTAQAVFLMMAATFCAIVLGIVASLIASIFHFGDGEAQKIISDMTPVALGSIGALSLVFTGHSAPSIISAIRTPFAPTPVDTPAVAPVAPTAG